jgi:multimeric flavodoxin WrbA
MEIKLLGICGSPVIEGNTTIFLREALKGAERGSMVNTELVHIADREIEDCRHCNWCLSKQEAGKFCVIQDGMTELYPKIAEADGILLASPVYLGRLSGYMATALDRLRCLAHGNYYRYALKDKVGGALVVGWLRDGGAETALISLFSAFIGLGMIPLSPSGYGFYGAFGMASREGTGKFEPGDRLGVLQDKHGLASARAVGVRVTEVAWLLKEGKKAVENRNKL